jgi:hypothetical protein
VKSFLELADIIVVEAVDVELHDSKNFAVVICSRGHVALPLLKTTLQFRPSHPIGHDKTPLGFFNSLRLERDGPRACDQRSRGLRDQTTHDLGDWQDLLNAAHSLASHH